MSKKITIGVLPFALSMVCVALVTVMLSRNQAASTEAVLEMGSFSSVAARNMGLP